MKQTGFTLIEILVSATIIGLLATIGIAGFQSVTRSGRDALRKTDLEQLRSALEIYKSEAGFYPTATTCVANLSSDYINPYPSDPRAPTFRYCYIRDSTLTYRLCAHLENGSTTLDLCGGTNNCGVNCNYQVTNP